jgi:hypothetical protein
VADLEARDLVKLCWEPIVAVAKALFKNKTLTRQQIREVIQGWRFEAKQD